MVILLKHNSKMQILIQCTNFVTLSTSEAGAAPWTFPPLKNGVGQFGLRNTSTGTVIWCILTLCSKYPLLLLLFFYFSCAKGR